MKNIDAFVQRLRNLTPKYFDNYPNPLITHIDIAEFFIEKIRSEYIWNAQTEEQNRIYLENDARAFINLIQLYGEFLGEFDRWSILSFPEWQDLLEDSWHVVSLSDDESAFLIVRNDKVTNEELKNE